MTKQAPNRTTVAVVKASDDRTIPAKHVGTIEPNYYCRGWNAKRTKYCRQRAGFGTAHPGVGRCKQHGGVQQNDGRVTAGRYRMIDTPELRELIEQHGRDPDPLNVREDLDLARALLTDFVRRYNAFRDALLKWHASPETESKPRQILDVSDAINYIDDISKVVHRVEQARAAYALSMPEFLRIMTEMGRQVEAHLSQLGRQLADDTEHRLDVRAEVAATMKRISDGWISIRR